MSNNIKFIESKRVNAIVKELNALAKNKWNCTTRIFNVWDSNDGNDIIITCDIKRDTFQKYFDEYDNLFDESKNKGIPKNRNIAFNELNSWIIEHVLHTDTILYNHSIAFFYEDMDDYGKYINTFTPTILTGNDSYDNVLLYPINDR